MSEFSRFSFFSRCKKRTSELLGRQSFAPRRLGSTWRASKKNGSPARDEGASTGFVYSSHRYWPSGRKCRGLRGVADVVRPATTSLPLDLCLFCIDFCRVFMTIYLRPASSVTFSRRKEGSRCLFVVTLGSSFFSSFSWALLGRRRPGRARRRSWKEEATSRRRRISSRGRRNLLLR